jgi:hypothetical protein
MMAVLVRPNLDPGADAILKDDGATAERFCSYGIASRIICFLEDQLASERLNESNIKEQDGISCHVTVAELALTRDSELLYASLSAAKAVLCEVPVELKPLASIAFRL